MCSSDLSLRCVHSFGKAQRIRVVKRFAVLSGPKKNQILEEWTFCAETFWPQMALFWENLPPPSLFWGQRIHLFAPIRPPQKDLPELPLQKISLSGFFCCGPIYSPGAPGFSKSGGKARKSKEIQRVKLFYLFFAVNLFCTPYSSASLPGALCRFPLRFFF